MKKATHLLGRLVLGAVAVLYGAETSAAPITLNFTAAPYNTINGQANAVVVDQGYTLAFGAGGSLLSQTSEGLGINSPVGDDGEIGCGAAFIICLGSESLGGAISPAFTLYEIAIQQLFTDDVGSFDEQGWYSVNGGPAQIFNAVSASGLLTINFGPAGLANVTSLAFSVPYNLFGINDYSVASLTVSSVSAVPEPAMLLLLGSGLVAVAVRTRRKTSRTN